MRKFLNLVRDSKGAALVEFALVAPILIASMMGVMQMGMMFQTSNGLQHAVDEATRFATIFPVPTDTEIQNRFYATAFGVDTSRITDLDVERGQNASGVKFVDVTVSYSYPVNLIPFMGDYNVAIQKTRRAYTY